MRGIIEQLAAGEADAHEEAVKRLELLGLRTELLLRAAVTESGTAESRAICKAHLDDLTWSRYVPLHLLEYRTVLGSSLHIHLSIQDALEENGWATRHYYALKQPLPQAQVAAVALLQDLDDIALEAAGLVQVLNRMRKRIVPPLHSMRVQALTRAELALGSFAGRRVLEVGSEDGALLDELVRLGAQATGVDIAPGPDSARVIRGDFMTAELPGPFALIIATAVFEYGSGWKHDDAGPALLQRLAQLTEVGSVAVVENIGYGMPFKEPQVRAAGFEVLDQRIPSIAATSGGRGCTLKRVG